MSVLRLQVKLFRGGGEVWIQAATAGALRRLCLGAAQRESIAFSLCSLARVLSWGSRCSIPAPCLAAVTNSSTGYDL